MESVYISDAKSTLKVTMIRKKKKHQSFFLSKFTVPDRSKKFLIRLFRSISFFEGRVGGQ